jgi:hypothetical protein
MKKRSLFILIIATVAIIFMSLLPARADIVQIDTGEEYNGKVTDLENTVRIEMLYGTITIQKYRIVRIIPRKTLPELYEEKLESIKQNDAEARYQLALWCKREGWTSKLKEELEIVIGLNTSHEGARRMLGYHKLNGEWLTEDEYMIARGFVKYQDKWLPKELAIELVKLEQTKEVSKAKTKEQKERRELFERSQQLAITSAFIAQRTPKYGRQQKKGGEFEFKYNFEDGSGFSVKASSFSDETGPRGNFYYPYLTQPFVPLDCQQ